MGGQSSKRRVRKTETIGSDSQDYLIVFDVELKIDWFPMYYEPQGNKRCQNYSLCGIRSSNKLCPSCESTCGQLNFTKRKENCPICLEKKFKVEFRCQHGLCKECLKGLLRHNKKLKCPLCRADNVIS